MIGHAGQSGPGTEGGGKNMHVPTHVVSAAQLGADLMDVIADLIVKDTKFAERFFGKYYVFFRAQVLNVSRDNAGKNTVQIKHAGTGHADSRYHPVYDAMYIPKRGDDVLMAWTDYGKNAVCLGARGGGRPNQTTIAALGGSKRIYNSQLGMMHKHGDDHHHRHYNNLGTLIHHHEGYYGHHAHTGDKIHNATTLSDTGQATGGHKHTHTKEAGDTVGKYEHHWHNGSVYIRQRAHHPSIGEMAYDKTGSNPLHWRENVSGHHHSKGDHILNATLTYSGDAVTLSGNYQRKTYNESASRYEHYHKTQLLRHHSPTIGEAMYATDGVTVKHHNHSNGTSSHGGFLAHNAGLDINGALSGTYHTHGHSSTNGYEHQYQSVLQRSHHAVNGEVMWDSTGTIVKHHRNKNGDVKRMGDTYQVVPTGSPGYPGSYVGTINSDGTFPAGTVLNPKSAYHRHVVADHRYHWHNKGDGAGDNLVVLSSAFVGTAWANGSNGGGLAYIGHLDLAGHHKHKGDRYQVYGGSINYDGSLSSGAKYHRSGILGDTHVHVHNKGGSDLYVVGHDGGYGQLIYDGTASGTVMAAHSISGHFAHKGQHYFGVSSLTSGGALGTGATYALKDLSGGTVRVRKGTQGGTENSLIEHDGTTHTTFEGGHKSHTHNQANGHNAYIYDSANGGVDINYYRLERWSDGYNGAKIRVAKQGNISGHQPDLHTFGDDSYGNVHVAHGTKNQAWAYGLDSTYVVAHSFYTNTNNNGAWISGRHVAGAGGTQAGQWHASGNNSLNYHVWGDDTTGKVHVLHSGGNRVFDHDGSTHTHYALGTKAFVMDGTAHTFWAHRDIGVYVGQIGATNTDAIYLDLKQHATSAYHRLGDDGAGLVHIKHAGGNKVLDHDGTTHQTYAKGNVVHQHDGTTLSEWGLNGASTPARVQLGYRAHNDHSHYVEGQRVSSIQADGSGGAVHYLRQHNSNPTVNNFHIMGDGGAGDLRLTHANGTHLVYHDGNHTLYLQSVAGQQSLVHDGATHTTYSNGAIATQHNGTTFTTKSGTKTATTHDGTTLSIYAGDPLPVIKQTINTGQTGYYAQEKQAGSPNYHTSGDDGFGNRHSGSYSGTHHTKINNTASSHQHTSEGHIHPSLAYHNAPSGESSRNDPMGSGGLGGVKKQAHSYTPVFNTKAFNLGGGSGSTATSSVAGTGSMTDPHLKFSGAFAWYSQGDTAPGANDPDPAYNAGGGLIGGPSTPQGTYILPVPGPYNYGNTNTQGWGFYTADYVSGAWGNNGNNGWFIYQEFTNSNTYAIGTTWNSGGWNGWITFMRQVING